MIALKNKNIIVLTVALCILIASIFAAFYLSKININFDDKITVLHNDIDITSHLDIIANNFWGQEYLWQDLEKNKASGFGYFKTIELTTEHIPDSLLPLKVIIKNKNDEIFFQHLVKELNDAENIIITPTGKKFINKLIILFKSHTTLLTQITLWICIILLFILLQLRVNNSQTSNISLLYIRFGIYFISALFLLNIVFLSTYYFPNTEDIEITYDVLNKKNPLKYLYESFDARYTTNLLYMYANPLYYKLSPKFVKIIPLLLVVFTLLSVYVLFGTFNNYHKKEYNLLLALLVVIVGFSFAPTISHTLFFMGASYHYTIFIPVFCLLISLFYKHFNNPSLKSLLLLTAIMIVFMGLNTFALMVIPLLLIVLFFKDLNKHKTLKKSTIFLFLVFGLIVLYIIMCPGHTNRMTFQTNTEFISKSVIERLVLGFYYSILANSTLLIKSVLKNSVIPICLIIFIAIIPKLFAHNLFNGLSKKMIFSLFLIINAYVLFVLPLPFYYSGIWSRAGSDYWCLRLYHNTVFFILIITNMFFISAWANTWQIKILNIFEKLRSKPLVAIIFISIIIMSIFSGKNIFTQTYQDIVSGSLSKYYQEVTKRHQQLYFSESDSIYVYEIRNKPKTLYTNFDYIGYNGEIRTRTFNKNKDVFKITPNADTILIRKVTPSIIIK